MPKNDEIEVLFEEETKTYHAFWRPPVAIGAGVSSIEALRDMEEAISFCVSTMVDSKCKEYGSEEEYEDES